MAENQKNKDSGDHVMIGQRHGDSPNKQNTGSNQTSGSQNIHDQGQSGQQGQAAAGKRQQEDDNTETAGGREGQFSNEDSLKDSQEKWSPGAGQSER